MDHRRLALAEAMLMELSVVEQRYEVLSAGLAGALRDLCFTLAVTTATAR